MKLVKLAVIAAISSSLVVPTAYAGEKKGGATHWNVTDAGSLLKAGDRVCYGDAKQKQGDCMIWNPYTRILQSSLYARPPGMNKNQSAVQGILTDEHAVPISRDGAPVTLYRQITETRNGASVFADIPGQMLGGAFNGAVAAGINAAANPCGGDGGCNNIIVGNGMAALANAESGSLSQAVIDASLSGSCGTTACPPARKD